MGTVIPAVCAEAGIPGRVRPALTREVFMRTNLMWVFAVIAIICFAVAIVGMGSSSSHRWVEPFEEAGWLFFVGVVLVVYLGNRTPDISLSRYSGLEKMAWVIGVLSAALFIFAIIASATTAAAAHPTWIEAIELAGILLMLVLIIIVVTESRKSGRGGNE